MLQIRKKGWKVFTFSLTAIVLCCACLTMVACKVDIGEKANSNSAAVVNQMNGSDALVYFLDVGQADSELIRLPSGVNVLIDAGTTNVGKQLVSYLKKLGVKKIDYLIATHPHEDHIGGMTDVINAFNVGNIYMPKVADSQIPTTKCYENLLDAIAKKGLKITQGRGGMTIANDGKAKLEFFAPNSSKYDDLNSYSIVTKFTFGDNRILFDGDADSDSEHEMIQKGYSLKCDVLKCGHHGSSTASSEAFLKAVNPKSAVISCGVNNSYGHPHREVLNRLNKMKITIYRTDQQNTILARCTGSKITITPNQTSVMK